MLFTCQRSGKCCTHPHIVVTLTHMDLWVLFEQVQNIEDLLKLIQFIVLDLEEEQKELVLHKIQTTQGQGMFILRKHADNRCIFYDESKSACNIHEFRPQACRNFPFAFTAKNNHIQVSLVKDAHSFCMGIGKGKDYKKKELENIGKHTLDVITEYNETVAEINKESVSNKALTPQDALVTLLLVAEKYKENKRRELQIL